MPEEVTAARIFLWLTAGVFAGFGLWGLLSPEAMVAKFGITIASADGKTLIRAIYGGFLIGEAALFGFCAASISRVRFGLQAVMLVTTPIFCARLIGMTIDGAFGGLHVSYLAIELAGIVIAALLLPRTKPR